MDMACHFDVVLNVYILKLNLSTFSDKVCNEGAFRDGKMQTSPGLGCWAGHYFVNLKN